MLNPTSKNEASRAKGIGGLLGGVVLAAMLAVGATGCVWAASADTDAVYGYPVARVETPPPNYYSYPRTYYRGSYAYFIDGSWYYESPRGWTMFREEPRELAVQRTYIVRDRARVVQPAPAARPRYYEARPRHYEAHPRHYEERRVPAAPREPVERSRRYHKR